MRILSVDSVPLYRQALLALCAEQWPDMKSLTVSAPKISIPAPLVALNSNSELLGGLVFSQYKDPRLSDLEHSETTLWVNAVVVRERNRRQGVASKLLTYSEVIARATGASTQFVLTDVPSLYQKQGWQVVEETAEGTVLSLSFSP